MFAAKHKAGHLLVKIQREKSVTVMILSKQNFLFDDVKQQQQQQQKKDSVKAKVKFSFSLSPCMITVVWDGSY